MGSAWRSMLLCRCCCSQPSWRLAGSGNSLCTQRLPSRPHLLRTTTYRFWAANFRKLRHRLAAQSLLLHTNCTAAYCYQLLRTAAYWKQATTHYLLLTTYYLLLTTYWEQATTHLDPGKYSPHSLEEKRNIPSNVLDDAGRPSSGYLNQRLNSSHRLARPRLQLARLSDFARSPRGEAVAYGLLQSMPYVLFLCFAFAPSISSRVFTAFACDGFGYDDRTASRSYFLHADCDKGGIRTHAATALQT